MSGRNNHCFSGNCKHAIQGEGSMHCNSPKKITYLKLKTNCWSCGRKPNINKGGCGICIGRGLYIYPHIYETCDCNGYERK
jgi:hypothetical protein